MSTNKSVYTKDAEEAKVKLDSVSPTFCLAKWNQVSLHLPTGLTNSCYHPPLHKIDAKKLKDNPAALHNTTEKLEQRQQMLRILDAESMLYPVRVLLILGYPELIPSF